jgi:hypothetical protein
MLMSPKADLIPTEKRLVLRFWQSTTGFLQTPPCMGAADISDFHNTSPASGLLPVGFLKPGLLQFRRTKGRNGHSGAGDTFCPVPYAAGSLALAIGSVWARMTTKRKWREWLSIHL